MGTFLAPLPTAAQAGALGTESPRVRPGAQGCPQPGAALASRPQRPPPPRLTRSPGGSGAPPSRPRRRRRHHGPRRAAAPGRWLAARSLPLANFRVLPSTRNRGTLSKSSRRRWWGSEGGGMSEPLRGRDRGRRAQRTASARGEAVAPGVPARIPAWETGPAGLSATRDLTKLQQQKRREGRGGRGTRSRRGSELALFV